MASVSSRSAVSDMSRRQAAYNGTPIRSIAKEVSSPMWTKIAVGAVVGFLVGSFAAPGLTLWVTVGVLAGYAVDSWTRRRAETGREGQDLD